jgi:hypothetical protein
MIKRRHPLKPHGVMLIGLTIAFTALIAGVIGFGYVTSKQKLASVEQPAKATSAPKISVSDIKPIINTTSLDEAAKQLSSLDAELNSDQCVRDLITNIESITN